MSPTTGPCQLLAALAVYSAAVVVLGRDVLRNINAVIIGPGDFDNFYYAWSIWEFKRNVLAGRLPGFTQDVYGRASSTPIFVEGFFDHLMALPLQWVLTPLGAYNVTVLSGFVLAGLTMYLLASAFTSNWTACLIAGLVFSFSTYHLARALGHLGLATVAVLPFCVWALILFKRRTNTPTALLAGLGVGLVPWAAMNYVAYFLVPLLALCAIGVLLSDWRWVAHGRTLGLLGLASGSALLVAAPSLVDYPFLKPDDLAAIAAQTSHWELRIYSANLTALALPDPHNPVLGSSVASLYPSLPGVPERSAYLGIPGLVLAALALLLRWRERATLAWVGVGVAGVALALGAGLRIGNRLLVELPLYDLAYRWPLLKSFAAPNRPDYRLPHHEELLRFLTSTLGAPFYAGTGEGLTAWHVTAGPTGVDPEAGYRLGSDWIPYLGSDSDGQVWRAMGARAQVIIDTASARESWLHLRVSPYTRPMTLEARMNGRVLATAWLSARTPQDLDLGPVWLEAGTGTVSI